MRIAVRRESNRLSLDDAAVHRREFLVSLGVGVALSLAPFPAAATPVEVARATAETLGNAKMREGRVALRVPEIAENGNSVPLGVTVESPMTPEDFVEAVHIFADGNPNPDVASFYFGPANGKAAITTRIRLAQTQKVVAVAKMSDGTVWIARKEIKVTIGGCGG